MAKVLWCHWVNGRKIVELTEVNGLKDMQRLVGGHVELVYIPELDLDMWVNEDGLLDSLPQHNVPVYIAPICGDFFFARQSDGETTSLKDHDIIVLELMMKFVD